MRRTPLIRIVFVVLSMAALAVQAQVAGAAAVASFESLGRALSGSWTLSIQFEPEPGKPRPAETRGTETWRASEDGLVLIEEEHLPTPRTDLHLLALVWQDRKTQTLGGVECNGGNPHVCDLKGALNDISIRWDGKQLVIEEIEHRPDGRTMLWREAYSEMTPRSFTQTGDIGPPGGPMKRVFTIHAARATDRAR
jgi:hypothetical protein